MTTENTISVVIPVQLAVAAVSTAEINGSWCERRNKGNTTRPNMKALAFYLLLKAQAPESGWILDYAKQIPELSLAFGISRRTFYNYLEKLETLKLAFRQGTRLRLVGWNELGNQLKINTFHRETVQYKLYGKFTLHLWFAALEIEFNQSLQCAALFDKLNQNSTHKHLLLSALCRRGYRYEDRNNRELFVNALFALYLKDFETGTEVHDLLVDYRSDLNRTTKTISRAWGNISASLVSFYKKQMVAHRIIDVAKVSIMSKYSRDTRECHKNRNCHVIWNAQVKERVWFLCDQISVMRPWLWDEFLNKLNAA